MVNLFYVRNYKKSDYQMLADFFNKNRVYQVNNAPLTAQDVELTFKAKEIKRMYLLFEKNKLIGTSGLFNFIYEGIYVNDGIYSGFLLIDSNQRNGQAIKALYETLYHSDEKSIFGTYYAEINLENKASLQLSKLNGYVAFDGSYEDTDHYLLLRSDLSKFSKTFEASGIFRSMYNMETLKKKNMYWNHDKGYVGNIEISKKDITLYLKEQHPWFIKLDFGQIYLIQLNEKYAKLFFSFDDTFIRNATVIVDEKEVYSTQKLNTDIKSNETIIPFSKGGNYKVVLENYDRKSKIAINLTAKPLNYLKISEDKNPIIFNGTFFSSIIFDSSNGDLTYFKGSRKIIVDSFARLKIPKDSVFVIEDKHSNFFSICLHNEFGEIKKNIEVNKDNLVISIDFSSYHDKGMFKFGPKIVHNNYYVESEEGHYQRFDWETNPKESMDFLKSSLFDKTDKKYLLEDGSIEMCVSSDNVSSNQMSYRPLFLADESASIFNYKISVKSLNTTYSSKRDFDLLNFNSQKISISNLRIFETNSSTSFIEHYEGVKKKLPEILCSSSQNNKGTTLIWNGSAKLRSDFLEVYFEIKQLGSIKYYDFCSSNLLRENGPWDEVREEANFVNLTTSRKFSVLADSTDIFFYKKRNKIHFRILIPANRLTQTNKIIEIN